MQTLCSFKFAIEKSTKTMTEAQEKNHTDPIDLSSRTPLGQLMRRAVEYTHQTGTDGTNAPLPSRKKFLVIFGSPLLHFKIKEILTLSRFAQSDIRVHDTIISTEIFP